MEHKPLFKPTDNPPSLANPEKTVSSYLDADRHARILADKKGVRTPSPDRETTAKNYVSAALRTMGLNPEPSRTDANSDASRWNLQQWLEDSKGLPLVDQRDQLKKKCDQLGEEIRQLERERNNRTEQYEDLMKVYGDALDHLDILNGRIEILRESSKESRDQSNIDLQKIVSGMEELNLQEGTERATNPKKVILYDHYTHSNKLIKARHWRNAGLERPDILSKDQEVKWVQAKHPSIEIKEYAADGTNRYINCHSLTFTRGAIGILDTSEVPSILTKENGFEEVASGNIYQFDIAKFDKVQVNDVVAYKLSSFGGDEQYGHTGSVSRLVYEEDKLVNIRVFGTWGPGRGNYDHDITDLPGEYGSVIKVFYADEEHRYLRRDSKPAISEPVDDSVIT